MTLFSKYTLSVLGILLTVTLLPSTTYAGDNIHAKSPFINVGFHGKYHHKKYRNRSYKHKHSKGYKYYNGYNDYYGKSYKKNSYNKYYNKGYNTNYKRGYDNNYSRDNYCPSVGYSAYNYKNRDCYQHDDHFHCD